MTSLRAPGGEVGDHHAGDGAVLERLDFTEILRVLDSLQLTAQEQVATPADWKQGEDVIIVPAVEDEQAAEKYPDGWNAPLPYLRYVKQPA